MKLLKTYCLFLISLCLGVCFVAHNSGVQYAVELNTQEKIESEPEESEIKHSIFSTKTFHKHGDGGKDFGSGTILPDKINIYREFSSNISYASSQRHLCDHLGLYLLFCSLKIHFC